jgi:hypothetical protein
VTIVLCVLCAAGGFALGVQAWRFSYCQQLSSQYTAALQAPALGGASAARIAAIEQTRDAYQRACS